MKTIVNFFRSYKNRMEYVKFIFGQMKDNEIYYYKDGDVEIKRSNKTESQEQEQRRYMSI